jgi:hypothetical protein
MPRLPTDYSNACIYKIVCKNKDVVEEYYGSTTNFINRKKQHTLSCNNEKNKDYNNVSPYIFIRENGGIDNWDMIIVEQLKDCKNLKELHKKEGNYIITNKSKLNKLVPGRTAEERRPKVLENRIL